MHLGAATGWKLGTETGRGHGWGPGLGSLARPEMGGGAYLEGELGRATGCNGTQGAPEVNAGGQRAGRQQHRGLWGRGGWSSSEQRGQVGQWK